MWGLVTDRAGGAGINQSIERGTLRSGETENLGKDDRWEKEDGIPGGNVLFSVSRSLCLRFINVPEEELSKLLQKEFNTP